MGRASLGMDRAEASYPTRLRPITQPVSNSSTHKFVWAEKWAPAGLLGRLGS
jgi:hypothetical protein